MMDDLVGRLRERIAAATALPWEMNPPGALWDHGMTYTVPAIGMDDRSYYPGAPEKENAELIVETVNALPTLLTRIEALEDEADTAAELLALVLWADPGVKEAAARKAARDWWVKRDEAIRAALTPENAK